MDNTPVPRSEAGEDPTTRLLLRRHHDGDALALQQLIVRELPAIREQVHRQLGGVLRRRMDTGDMVQEICLLILRKGPRFLVRDPGCFRALMARIIRNQIVSAYRAFGPAAEREASLHPTACLDLDRDLDHGAFTSPDTAPPDRAAREEDRERVRLALLLLDPLDAEVMRLRDDVDLSFVEVGKRLGRPADNVRMRYQRALRKLERCIMQLGKGDLDHLLSEVAADDEDPGLGEVSPAAPS